MGNGPTATYDRRRAIELKAAGARELINSALPAVLQIMTPAQLTQVQKVLDAAVVNPVINQEIQDLMKKYDPTPIGTHGQVYEDEEDKEIKRRAYKRAERKIPVTEADKRVRLDFTKLLAPDALKPTTDNPDEAAYLASVRTTLVSEGVWLRVDYKLVPNPDEPHHVMIDPRSFQVWLSLGSNGGPIPTDTGRLTRDALLDTGRFATGYYDKVYRGSIQITLENAIKHVENMISTGETWHEMEERNREEHPVCARIVDSGIFAPIPPSWWGSSVADLRRLSVDGMGLPDFPSMKIWDAPNRLVLQARKLNVGGNVKESSKLIFFAAMLTQHALKALAKYERATIAGTHRVLKILKIAETAGKIAEVVLVTHQLAGMLVRAMAGEAAGRLALSSIETAAAAKNRSPAAYYDTNLVDRRAFEKTLNQVGATLDSQAGIGAVNRYDIAAVKQAQEAEAEFQALLRIYEGKSISYSELEEIIRIHDKKWGPLW
jgi:hypothetical protein